MTRLADWSHFKTPTGQKCYLCLRYKPLPMCPERTMDGWRARQDENANWSLTVPRGHTAPAPYGASMTSPIFLPFL
jgi:uncharacterized membrane protein